MEEGASPARLRAAAGSFFGLAWAEEGAFGLPASPVFSAQPAGHHQAGGPAPVNQSELVKQVAALVDQPVTTTSAVIDAALARIMVAVAKGDVVKLQGFGQFEFIARGKRAGRNPQTGEPKDIPPMKVPKFRPGRSFRDVVNGVTSRPKRPRPTKKMGSPDEPALPGFE